MARQLRGVRERRARASKATGFFTQERWVYKIQFVTNEKLTLYTACSPVGRWVEEDIDSASVENVDDSTEFTTFVLLDLSLLDEFSEICIWAGSWVEFSGAFFEIWNEFVGFVDVWDRATGGAGDSSDEPSVTALSEHLASGGVVGVNDNSVGNITSQLWIGIAWGVEDFGIDAAHSLLGVASLNR